MKRFWWFFFGMVFFFSGLVAALVWRGTRPFPAEPLAVAALRSEEAVRVVETAYGWAFQPTREVQGGFVFYPGGRVDPRAYAPLLRPLAEAGYLVALLKVPFHLAITAPDKALEAMRAHPEVSRWVVGGHSLGGVAAASFAQGHEVAGLVLWAAYPQDDLSERPLPVLAIYATHDGLVPPETAQEKQAFLPPNARIVWIEGGNHAGFGAYGAQPGDREARIERRAQWEQVLQATRAFLDEALTRP
ncbi:alpha/beta hydrolase [Marinithermus hydrothermalis]|uniref:Alpha/beta hydrolase fold-5 domain-containing protein n=1 Tax=Marinithermus hydrothermalis (strain DSM 14884 / JCM 11576 / T1) TaxID=869210 RepID=F2NP46_MARHT|nr:alpha/beta hydrolase [Marinithermus hydrothermalis]AEB11847.1 hypothetical protein Marky_1105 [Marinithermus hydrothermalis DSM 14884]